MFNSTVKTTRDFWRKTYPEWASLIYLRSEESFEITRKRSQARVNAISRNPPMGHWIKMYWCCKQLAKTDSWYYTQMELAKALWRKDIESNN